MKSLDCLNATAINVLQKSNLLKSLVIAELRKEVLSKVEIDEQLKQSTVNKFLNSNGLDSEEKLNKFLEQNFMKKEEVENFALSSLRLKEYCNINFSKKVESRFLEKKNHLDIVVYSLIRLNNDPFKANEIYLRLKSKEAEFGDLATLYSEGPEKKTRGIVGPLPVDNAHPNLIPMLINGKEGEIQPPVEIAGMHLVLRVESYDAAKLDDFMREKMALELFDEWIDEKAIDLSNQLRDEARESLIEGQAL
ncbi:peptidylprolyl isomerase [Prochlorococcus sp. MIT 0916]|uniref:peptidylprolyl isomerase n=1 Tax=Prochlorococcus marinus str. P0903-H212 TaxID=1622208 RepID=A0A0D5A411_PROMR|nr:hypothetical protein FA03_0129 [Prochlorococcus marinus str. P0903-H212]